MKVEPNLDGAEGEGEDLEDLLVRREASAGAGEERRRVEQRPATFLLNFPLFEKLLIDHLLRAQGGSIFCFIIK